MTLIIILTHAWFKDKTVPIKLMIVTLLYTFVIFLQSDAGVPPSLRGLHSALNMSQQSITSFGSQETDAKMAKVLYDYAVSCDTHVP